ncbi:hypothetical protein WG66_013299 [Moniliophthora roreri]|nr:hypothetical protein WG66_013299 [Moniliophthora roreri]
MSNTIPFESIYSIQGALLGPFVIVGLILFLLGFYVLLFGMAIYFLLTRRNMVNKRLHLGWVIALFVLSVSSALFEAGINLREAALAFHAVSTQDTRPLEEWEFVPFKASRLVPDTFSRMFYVLANCIADSILLYRCFIIWGSRKHVIIVPLLVLLATNAFGLVAHSLYLAAAGMDRRELLLQSISLTTGYTIANAVNTPLLTVMIAGRIWWMTRDARKFMRQEIKRTHQRIILILVESGFMYSASLSVNSLCSGLTLDGVVYLVVGIAPTLIILRTSLRLTESAVPDPRMISTLQFGVSPAAAATNGGQNSEAHTMDPEQGTASEGDED